MAKENTSRKVYRFDDSIIAKIVQIIQIGMLTGTDISDHMRQMVVEADSDKPGKLVMTPEYIAEEAKNLDRMFDHLEDLMDNNPEPAN